MAWFHCLIRGENFPGQLVGQEYPVGFFVNRFVEANDAAEAESCVLDELRTEPKLAPPSGYQSSGQAQVFFERITEVEASAVPAVPSGFVWYPMNADNAWQTG
jgi:hypothetical protein